MIRGKIDIPELVLVLELAGVDEVRYWHIPDGFREESSCNGEPMTDCVLMRNGEVLAGGHAYLNPKDNFCRRTGREVSLRRAVEQLDTKGRRCAKSA